jgi:hypothetical protein
MLKTLESGVFYTTLYRSVPLQLSLLKIAEERTHI